MYVSMNFLSKRAFVEAVERRLPLVVYSPVMEMPAINGEVHVEGPWPKTPVPVEVIKHGREEHERKKLRGWRARVRVQNMEVVEVLN